MLAFKCKPEIYQYKTVEDFIKEFNVGEKDLIVTLSFLHDTVFKPLNLNCKFIFQDKYGLGEPTDEMILSMFKDLENVKFDRVIAIGGGTIIDIAKLMTLPELKENIELYSLFKKEVKFEKKKELIIIPTTCGTGSEVTNISIVGFVEKNTKFGLAIEELYADNAVLIEELFKTLPYGAFITSSIDALIHAIESYLSPKSNQYTELFSKEAIKMILKGYIDIKANGLEYRTKIINDFVIASNYAGIAFGNTGVGAVHALSYPLGGKYHVPHGEANYQFLTAVLRAYYNGNSEGKINEVNEIIAEILEIENNSNVVYDKLEELLSSFLEKNRLNKYGMLEEDIEGFTKLVIETQQRLLVNNYVALSEDDISNIYKVLF